LGLRAALQATPKSRLSKKIPFFDPKPYVDKFLQLDLEIGLLRPKMIEDAKLTFQDVEMYAEDPRVWRR
jgi:hypothetical protein